MYGYGYGYDLVMVSHGSGYGGSNMGVFACDGDGCWAQQNGYRGGKPGAGWKTLEYKTTENHFCPKEVCQEKYRRLKKLKKRKEQPQQQQSLQQSQQPHQSMGTNPEFATWLESAAGQQELKKILYAKFQESSNECEDGECQIEF